MNKDYYLACGSALARCSPPLPLQLRSHMVSRLFQTTASKTSAWSVTNTGAVGGNVVSAALSLRIRTTTRRANATSNGADTTMVDTTTMVRASESALVRAA